MGIIIYRAFLLLYLGGIRIAAVFNTKARAWLEGRRIMPSITDTGKTVWMHCASLGEFEQGRPVIESIKAQSPSTRIILTFFSPSGYEIRKNYALADLVCYLPMDSPAHAKKFIEMTNPSLVIWVKYEYWYYYLKELNKRNIPVLLVSAVFRSKQPFFAWYGKLWKEMLGFFRVIFVQNEDSYQLLKDNFPKLPVTICGDTRFDRVSKIAEEYTALPQIQEFCKGKKVLVAGSTWEEDEDELIHYVNNHPEIIFIIAPHVIDKENIKALKKRFKNSICYSDIQHEIQDKNCHVLLIDNIGMLSKLYYYADITYIGGGFGNNGIHNILEAAVYGKPVIIGPCYQDFFEAVDLIEKGGCFSINHALELEKLLDNLWSDHEKMKKAGAAALDFVKERKGATKMIMNYIQENRLLIS